MQIKLWLAACVHCAAYHWLEFVDALMQKYIAMQETQKNDIFKHNFHAFNMTCDESYAAHWMHNISSYLTIWICNAKTHICARQTRSKSKHAVFYYKHAILSAHVEQFNSKSILLDAPENCLSKHISLVQLHQPAKEEILYITNERTTWTIRI